MTDDRRPTTDEDQAAQTTGDLAAQRSAVSGQWS
jgi:hypothetical protein